jgi:hypothetical protein
MNIYQAAIASTNLVITNLNMIAGTTGIVHWTWQPDVTYQVQYVQSVSNAAMPYWQGWTDLGGLVTAPTNWQYDPDLSLTGKHYRVIVPLVP